MWLKRCISVTYEIVYVKNAELGSDVTFRKDDCRIRKENGTANFATINHAAINLLKRVPGKKMSLPQKRRSAAWNDDYMEVIIRQ